MGVMALVTDKETSLWHEVRGSSPRTARSLRSRLLLKPVFRRPGGFGGEPEPDPIPNSAVKLSRANGTKSQDLEE